MQRWVAVAGRPSTGWLQALDRAWGVGSPSPHGPERRGGRGFTRVVPPPHRQGKRSQQPCPPSQRRRHDVILQVPLQRGDRKIVVQELLHPLSDPWEQAAVLHHAAAQDDPLRDQDAEDVE